MTQHHDLPVDITGPNTTAGHTSVIFSEESQVTYLLKPLGPVRAGALKTLSVAQTDAAIEWYTAMLEERLEP